MGKALESNAQAANGPARRLDWRKGMSDNVASALMVYTALQIYVTVQALKVGFTPMISYIALILLVAAIIPACRVFERRWLHIGDQAAADGNLRGAYRRDQALLWILAIGLPFVVTGLCKALFALA